MLQNIFNVSNTSLGLCVLAVLVLYLILSVLLDSLRDIPGPLAARFTRLWYLLEIYKGSFEVTDIDTHRKYGPIVGVAPGEYSIDYVVAARTIYGHENRFLKACMIRTALCFLVSEF